MSPCIGVQMGLPMFAEQYLWLFFGLVAFGAFTQGFSGVGYGMVVLAGMAFTPWDLERTILILNLMLPLLHVSIIYATLRKSRINWKLVGVLLVGAGVGVPLGYWFIMALGKQPIFRVILGLALTLFSANELIRPRIHKDLNLGFGLVAGLMGGFLSGGFLTAGPPLALFLYSRFKDDPAQGKGTLQIVFIICTFWRLAAVMIMGHGITLPLIKLAAQGLPFLVVFAFLGHRLSRRIPSRTFLKIVYSLIATAGIINVFKGLLSIWE